MEASLLILSTLLCVACIVLYFAFHCTSKFFVLYIFLYSLACLLDGCVITFVLQDDEDEEEGDEEEGGGLSKSGKELKKLLGRANGLNDSDAEDEDDDDDDVSNFLVCRKF